MDVSVVIPSYNTEKTIGQTLQSLQLQKGTCSKEVILVDCSEHENVRKIASSYEGVRYLHVEKRFNPGEGRNTGARIAEGKLVIFIDGDILLHTESVEKAWKHYCDGSKIFGGALELNRQTSVGLSSWLEHFFFNHESQHSRPPCERANLSSALICFDKKLFLDEGGFRDIPRMQDTELTERLRKKGHKLEFYPDVAGYQTQDAPISKVLRKIYINGQNIYNIRYMPEITFNRKVFFFLFLPLLGLAKATRIIFRHLRFQPWGMKARTLGLALPLVFATAYWVTGFYNAMIFSQGISNDR